jgi:DNA-directed RNA polymerase subunit RPC12/RpoP
MQYSASFPVYILFHIERNYSFTKFIYYTAKTAFIQVITNNSEVSEMTEGRCMKCKDQVQIKDGKEVTMKNGMKAMKGVCPKCGTKVFRILGKA